MKITIESTDVRVMLDPTGTGVHVPARMWQGETESGIPVHMFVTLIAPEIPPDDPRQAEFERELDSCATPRATVAGIPHWMVL